MLHINILPCFSQDDKKREGKKKVKMGNGIIRVSADSKRHNQLKVVSRYFLGISASILSVM